MEVALDHNNILAILHALKYTESDLSNTSKQNISEWLIQTASVDLEEQADKHRDLHNHENVYKVNLYTFWDDLRPGLVALLKDQDNSFETKVIEKAKKTGN